MIRAMLLPSVSRRVFYPLHERLLGRPTLAYLNTLEHTQWLSREAVERLQMEKLGTLLRIAAKHCPWHADRIEAAELDLGKDARLTTLDELRRLPRMTKQDARQHVDRMLWRDVPGGAFRYNTGGSSGEPLIFYFGRWRQASDAATRIRARRWWDVDLGDREVYVWGAPTELNNSDRLKVLRDRLMNQLVLNAFDMSPANMDAYLGVIQDFEPKCIYGYPSSVALLAAHAKSKEIRPRWDGLQVVCTTGEPLYPHQRTLIEEIFGVPVANEFGSRDIGFTAHETPCGQILLASESVLLEVLDDAGRLVSPGELGEAVMTGLCSDAQPFIRYRTGDMIRMSEERCRQGRGLHVIEEVLGRTTDFVVRSDGTIMHALAIIYILRAIEGIAEFKFIQHTVREVDVLLVTDARWTGASAEAVKAGIAGRLGADVRVNLRILDAIPAEVSGKHRYVISHVPLHSGLEQAMRPRETT